MSALLVSLNCLDHLTLPKQKQASTLLGEIEPCGVVVLTKS
jgi:hypothetical protein